MKPIAENTYNFERMRRLGTVYVDKTGALHDLIMDLGRQLYFIARPRRFGKSLMISTLKAIFDGRRELFEGLAIAERDYDWQAWPVLHFSFAGVETSSLEAFRLDFASQVKRTLQNAGVVYDDALSAGRNFSNALCEIRQKTGKEVVLLMDEYDAPIAHALENPVCAEAIRDALSNFYIHIKENEGYIRFLMMTGVTQFSKLSVFSSLSNLTDLTLEPEAATLLGYTEEELHAYFGEHMAAHAESMGCSLVSYFSQLTEWCDGYRFSGRVAQKVYNPVSVGLNFARRESSFQSSWSKTGHASILMNYVRTQELASMDYEEIRHVPESHLTSCEVQHLRATTLLFQTGYLTIRDYDPTRRTYTLGVPNEEVREELAKLVVYSQKGKEQGESLFTQIASALLEARFEEAQRLLCVQYSGLVYGPKEDTGTEAAYQRILQVILSAGGFRVLSEVAQAIGRADVVAIHSHGIFVFELKVNQAVELAFLQMDAKQYTLPYQAEKIPLYAVGISFDSKTKNICEMRAVRV